MQAFVTESYGFCQPFILSEEASQYSFAQSFIYLILEGTYYGLGTRDVTERYRQDLSEKPVNLLIVVSDILPRTHPSLACHESSCLF